jgi:hypothetical protein
MNLAFGCVGNTIVSTLVPIQKLAQIVATIEQGSQLQSSNNNLQFETRVESSTRDRIILSIPTTIKIHAGILNFENDDQAM